MSKTGQRLSQILEGEKTQKNAEDLLRKAGIDPNRIRDAAMVDDGTPPLAPTNLVAGGFLESVTLEWDDPPYGDCVVSSFIQYRVKGTTPPNPPSRETSSTNGEILRDMDPQFTYELRVKFYDYWGRESEYTPWVEAKPKETADHHINLEKARLQGNLEGMIEAINIELESGATFAEEINDSINVTAASQPTNMLTLAEVDFEGYEAVTRNMTGTVDTNPNYGAVLAGSTQWPWPPRDKLSDGSPAVIAQIPTANELSVKAFDGVNWLVHKRNAGATGGSVIPFRRYTARQTIPGQEYIFSAHVAGASGTQVRVRAFAASGAAATDVEGLATGQTLTLEQDTTVRLSVKFLASAVKPAVAFGLEVLNAGEVRWTRFKLEPAEGRNEPSPWDPGIFTTGVISTRFFSALDLVSARAFFQDASIESAKIKSVVADIIETGDLKAGRMISCYGTIRAIGEDGEIRGGGGFITKDGFQIRSHAQNLTRPHESPADWFSSGLDNNDNNVFAGMGFYRGLGGTATRGVNVSAMGQGGTGVGGQVFLQATPGPGSDYNAETSSFIRIRSVIGTGGEGEGWGPGQRPFIELDAERIQVNGPMFLPFNTLHARGLTIEAAGQTGGNASISGNLSVGGVINNTNLDNRFSNVASSVPKVSKWDDGTLGKGKGDYFSLKGPLFITQFLDSNKNWVSFVGGANSMVAQVTSTSKVYIKNGSDKTRAVRVIGIA